MSTALTTAILDALHASAALETFLAELCAAQRHGNPDRIGNAAYDLQLAAEQLAEAACLVFARAAENSALAFDADWSGSDELGKAVN